MKKKVYIFEESTNLRFSQYFGQRCTIRFFRDEDTDLLRASIDFVDLPHKWVRTSIMKLPPKNIDGKHLITTINSVYTFTYTGMEI